MKAFLILVLTGAFFFSCTEEKIVEERAIDFQTNTKSMMSKGCESPDSLCAKIVVEYPVLDESETDSALGEIQKKIDELVAQPVITEEKFDSFEQTAKHFIAEYQNFVREFPDTKQSWEVKRTTKIVFNRIPILSFQHEDFSYTGGAHPNTMIKYYNFKTTTGELLKLDQIINAEKLPDLLTLAESEFRKSAQIDKNKSLEEAGFWFDNNQFYLPDNYLITKEGLKFLFNSYEVAPYSMGQIEFEIPYDKLKGMLLITSLMEK